MASTYSPLKIELMGTGDQSGTWGNTTNTNLGTAIEEAITGSAAVTFSGSDITLTLTNTNTSQIARNLRLVLTGTSSGALNLTVPDIEKFYIIDNELSDDVTVKNSTGTTYTVPAGTTGQVFSTGAGVKAGIDFFAGAVLSSAVVILGGAINGTTIGAIGASTGAFTTLSATGALTYGGVTLSNAVTGTGNMVLSASPTLTGSPIAPTQTAGDNSTKIATTQYVATAVTNATGSLGTMSTQNASSVAITGGTINGTTIGATTPSTGAFSTLNAAGTTTLGETTTVAATVATGTVTYDVITQGVLYYTSNASSNWTMNFRGNGSTSLNTLMAVGETRAVTFLVTQGATPYYASAFQVDGNSVTPKWQGGIAPTSGNASSIDVYTFSIIKTASATFTVLASQTKFA
jgi:hypothetical protein